MNRIAKCALLVVVASGVFGSVGTAGAATVRYDIDRSVDVSGWESMAWVPTVKADSSIQGRRIARAIESGFAGRGYTLVADPQQADFLVTYRAAAWRDVRLETTAYSPAFGRSARLEREPMGSLAIQVVDRRTGKVVWHGVVSDALAGNPDQADKRTTKAVEKLLKKFPARGGGR